jgi:hypothetical protein
VSDPTPIALADQASASIVGWPTRRLSSRRNLDDDDGYPGHDMGGSD